MEEPALVVCRTLNFACHLSADSRAQARGAACSSHWMLGQTKTIIAAALQAKGHREEQDAACRKTRAQPQHPVKT